MVRFLKPTATFLADALAFAFDPEVKSRVEREHHEASGYEGGFIAHFALLSMRVEVGQA